MIGKCKLGFKRVGKPLGRFKNFKIEALKQMIFDYINTLIKLNPGFLHLKIFSSVVLFYVKYNQR